MLLRNAAANLMAFAMLLPTSGQVRAQDIPGIEICTVEKTMERRTSCLQSNVDFLQKTMAKLSADHQQKIDAANRQIEALKAAIVADPAAIETLLTEFEGDAGRPTIAAHQDEIARIFALDGVEAIVDALKAADTDWARQQLEILSAKSPQTLKVAFRQLKLGQAAKSFAENMAMEYRIASLRSRTIISRITSLTSTNSRCGLTFLKSRRIRLTIAAARVASLAILDAASRASSRSG